MSQINLPKGFRTLLNEYCDGFCPSDVKRNGQGWDLMWDGAVAATVDSAGKVCYVDETQLTFFLDEFMRFVYHERCIKTYSRLTVDDVDSDSYKYI